MRKVDELQKPESCLSKAERDEMLFVLLGRDAAGPATIRFWVAERIRIGKNLPNDPQITDALACAEVMERERLEAEEFGRGLATANITVRPPDVTLPPVGRSPFVELEPRE